MSLSQYVASPQFPTLGSWDKTSNNSELVVKGSAVHTNPVRAIMVVSIASDRAFLETHGNHNLTYTAPERIERAKIQIQCEDPIHDEDFHPDYDVGYKALETVQASVANTNIRQHFLQPGRKMTFNFSLFAARVRFFFLHIYVLFSWALLLPYCDRLKRPMVRINITDMIVNYAYLLSVTFS